MVVSWCSLGLQHWLNGHLEWCVATYVISGAGAKMKHAVDHFYICKDVLFLRDFYRYIDVLG